MSSRFAEGDGGSGVSVDLSQFLTPGLILGLLVAVGVLLVIVTLVGWVALHRLRKRGTLETGLLRAQAQMLPPGVARDAAELRLTLREAIHGASKQVLAAAEHDPTLADLPLLVKRLGQEARALDLSLAELHPVPPTNGRQQLTLMRSQAQQLIASADHLRAAVREVSLSSASTAQLSTDMRDALETLAARRDALRELRSSTPETP